MLSPVPSTRASTAEQPQLPQRRWVSAWVGGSAVTLALLLLLAWLQPETKKDQPVAKPTFKFKLTQEPEARKEPPPPPPRPTKAEPKRPEPQQQAKAQRASRPAPTKAPRSAARRTSSLSSVAGVQGGFKLSSFGAGGGGPILARVDDSYTEFAQKAEELVRYWEGRSEGRARPPRSGAIRSRGPGTRDPVPGPLLAPNYPRDAEKKQIEGYVKVRMQIDRSGNVREYEIIEAEPPGVFEAEMKKVIPKWKYRPATDAEGRPVEAWVDLKYEFRFPR
ncbi:MAG: energy transducer TonB [Planctomycetota bacterium]